MAAMEAPLDPRPAAPATGAHGKPGPRQCGEWSWPVVERRSLPPERRVTRWLLPATGLALAAGRSGMVLDESFALNRRDTEPYVRWCGRTAGASPPPTRLTSLTEAAGTILLAPSPLNFVC